MIACVICALLNFAGAGVFLLAIAITLASTAILVLLNMRLAAHSEQARRVIVDGDLLIASWLPRPMTLSLSTITFHEWKAPDFDVARGLAIEIRDPHGARIRLALPLPCDGRFASHDHSIATCDAILAENDCAALLRSLGVDDARPAIDTVEDPYRSQLPALPRSQEFRLGLNPWLRVPGSARGHLRLRLAGDVSVVDRHGGTIKSSPWSDIAVTRGSFAFHTIGEWQIPVLCIAFDDDTRLEIAQCRADDTTDSWLERAIEVDRRPRYVVGPSEWTALIARMRSEQKLA